MMKCKFSWKDRIGTFFSKNRQNIKFEEHTKNTLKWHTTNLIQLLSLYLLKLQPYIKVIYYFLNNFNPLTFIQFFNWAEVTNCSIYYY